MGIVDGGTQSQSANPNMVYRGLDVLTNKVPPQDQNGVPHHLLGTVSPDVEFTAKDFRDSAIPVIDDILSRGCLPMIVGGTNYYIQALFSPLLLDDSTKNIGGSCSSYLGDEEMDIELDEGRDSLKYDHSYLKEIDPVSAGRLHPNNHRKINQYLSLYYRTGVLPSTLFQGKAAESWGQADSFRYECCLICVDASIPQIDGHVDSRVDSMLAAGLLDEVYDIYNPNANYTRGLWQAIGVREFEEFLRYYVPNGRCDEDSNELSPKNSMECNEILKENMRSILNSTSAGESSFLLKEAIDNVKLNTRRLVRRQRRQIKRLETLFGWKIHYVDSTEYITSKVEDSWTAQVVVPAVQIIRSFLEDCCSATETMNPQSSGQTIKKDLWTQYVCQACGNKVLRGAHEWEQHNLGRSHRKRMYRLKKHEGSSFLQQKLPQE
ncbi:tRNA dimethylallyltransferase 2 isoform X2 [Cucurbita pepo subsp. pepo]|uniref:tRNA dimethylallyltransferase 2 isoform X2 n=1 Tax=Cucurbita pepo subsp. pepo TaxID=3664 RepID=UPI000C9D36BE|nr:tRNA dimethylallyltransferase 2 isoform X2 [Cucurbita pepo subsp. pepo]